MVTAESCLLTVSPAAGAADLSLKGGLDGAAQSPPQTHSPAGRTHSTQEIVIPRGGSRALSAHLGETILGFGGV